MPSHSISLIFKYHLPQCILLTGNTTGMPPRTGLLPSSFAALLSQSLSFPAVFQLMTEAPNSRTSTESPVGSVAITLPCSTWTEG